MFRVARSANDMGRAQTYAKRLLRMSHGSTLRQWAEALVGFMIPVAIAADSGAAPRPPPGGMRPYDPENYQLAYDIFLASQNLQDAYRVAHAAVEQVPNDFRWRERLAQVSEWTGRSAEALEQWLYIARRTNNPNAWQAVLRLAPGAANDEVLIEALKHQARTAALTETQWRAMVAAYERLGRVREAIEFLEQEYARRQDPTVLETLAYLRERAGDIDGAIVAYRRLIERSEPTTQRVTTLAILLINKGEFKEAYDLLERNRRRAPPEDVEYLRLLGDLALRLRDDAAAQVAYERLVVHPKANLDDFVRLVNLLYPRQPEVAARLAEAAYQRYRSPDMLLTALSIHSQRRDFGALKRLFSSIPPEMEQKLAANVGFLLLRADYRASTGSPALALADYREALRIDPNNRQARIAMLYFLIARHDVDQLRREMPAAMALAKEDPDFEGVVGSAWLTLGIRSVRCPSSLPQRSAIPMTICGCSPMPTRSSVISRRTWRGVCAGMRG